MPISNHNLMINIASYQGLEKYSKTFSSSNLWVDGRKNCYFSLVWLSFIMSFPNFFFCNNVICVKRQLLMTKCTVCYDCIFILMQTWASSSSFPLYKFHVFRFLSLSSYGETLFILFKVEYFFIKILLSIAQITQDRKFNHSMHFIS